MDAESVPQAVAVPSVFLALDWRIDELSEAAREHYRTAGAASMPALAAMKEAIAVLRTEAISGAVESLFDRAVLDLPLGSLLLHLGVLLGRRGQGLRASVQILRRDATAYLRHLGYAATDALEDTLARYGGVAGFDEPAADLQLDFDMGPKIGDRLGLTLSPAQRGPWSLLLDRLVEDGLCTTAKRTALLQWPGRTAGITAVGPLWIEHYLSHLKICIAPNQCGPVKAYFGLRVHAPLSDRNHLISNN
jgi:hypothetical protein